MSMKFEKTTTGVIIREPSATIKGKCLKYFSLDNPVREYFVYSGNDADNKPLFGHDRDVIYISSGFLKMNDSEIKEYDRRADIIAPKTPKSVNIEMNRQPRSDLQRDCIEKLTTSKSSKITVELKPGTGKASPYSEKIPTPTSNGYTTLGDLKVGDFVFGRDGKPTRILKIFEQGEMDIFKVTFKDGRTVMCTEEHLWTVKTSKNGRWQTKMLKEMLGDFRRISKWKVEHGCMDPYAYKYMIPLCQPVEYPSRPVPIHPWVLGAFIGNGCRAAQDLTISSVTSDIPKKIAEIYNFELVPPKSGYSYTFRYNTGRKVKSKDFFKDIPEIVGTHSEDRGIPALYRYNSPTIRLMVLQGLMDTNGSIAFNEGRYNTSFISTSHKLLEHILEITQSFGWSGTISSSSREYKYVNGYCGHVTIRMKNSQKHLLFRWSIEKRKIALLASDYPQNGRYDDLLITNIEFSHREKARCIMVDNDEHLYLTDDYIVTHNTFISLYSISKLGMKPFIVAPTTLLKNQWTENLIDLGIDKNDIANKIEDAPNKTFCVVTISALERAMREDWEKLMKTIDDAQFGIKIIDEAHLHLKGMLKLDSVCNIKHNWYLSATLGRSDAAEDRILNRALADADRFIGNSLYEEYQKEYVNIYFQDIYYFPSARLCGKTLKSGKKGLIRSTYYNMLMQYRNGKPFIDNIINMIKVGESISKNKGKILVLVPLLSTIKVVLDEIVKDSNFRGKKISGVDGSMSIREKREALESDIILSTSASMGVGVDIMGLSTVINFDQYSSPIITEQIVGRLRDRGEETHYIDICDHVKYAKSIESWGRKRRVLLPYFPGVKPDIKNLRKIMC